MTFIFRSIKILYDIFVLSIILCLLFISEVEKLLKSILTFIIPNEISLLLYTFSKNRFGEVNDIGTLSDGSITVKFKERRDAESAKMKGAFYNSGVLLMDWLEAGENRDA